MVMVRNLIHKVEKFIKTYKKEYGECIKIKIEVEFDSGRKPCFEVVHPDYTKIKKEKEENRKVFENLFNKIYGE